MHDRSTQPISPMQAFAHFCCYGNICALFTAPSIDGLLCYADQCLDQLNDRTARLEVYVILQVRKRIL